MNEINPLAKYQGLSLSSVSENQYEEMQELARGPGTCCTLRFSKKHPELPKYIGKFANFKSRD